MKYTVIFLISIFTLASCTMDKSSQIQDIKSDTNTGVISSTTSILTTDITIYPLIVYGDTMTISGVSLFLNFSTYDPSYSMNDPKNCERSTENHCDKWQLAFAEQQKKFTKLSEKSLLSNESGNSKWCYALENEITLSGSFVSGGTKVGMQIGIPNSEIGKFNELPMVMWWKSTYMDYINNIFKYIDIPSNYPIGNSDHDTRGLIASDIMMNSGTTYFTTMGSVRKGKMAHAFISYGGCVDAREKSHQRIILPLGDLQKIPKIQGFTLKFPMDLGYFPNPSIEIHNNDNTITILPIKQAIISEHDMDTLGYTEERNHWIFHLSPEILQNATRIEIVGK